MLKQSEMKESEDNRAGGELGDSGESESPPVPPLYLCLCLSGLILITIILDAYSNN